MRTKRKIHYLFFTIIFLLVIAAAYFQFAPYSLELSHSEEELTLEYGQAATLSNLTACYRVFPFREGGIELPVTPTQASDRSNLGPNKISYSAKFLWKTLEGTGSILVVDTLPPEITLVESPEHYTSPVGTYEEEGYRATDLYDGDLTDKVVCEERDGKVYYTVTDSSGNIAKKERIIVYKDVISPIIKLKGGEECNAQLNGKYKDPGFSAKDECDGDITKNVSVTGKVDTGKEGTYTLTYRVEDSSGNVTEVKRVVTVKDLHPPVITLSGKKDLYIKIGTTYREPGYSAKDTIDGDVTSKVKVTGSVDTSKMGDYTIQYKVTDSKGNTATAKRHIFVYKQQAVANPQNPGKKVVYLTFDDGPSRHTARLLEILDKYNVKATFFVTNQFKNYQHMIGKAHKKGHTIALHTYSHSYAKVYASEDAYFKDLGKIESVVKKQTGTVPTIVRFPGGTNNTVSRHYNTGIMTRLCKRIAYHGYLYCDWNVSSGDAGGTRSTDGVYKNVISGIKKHDVSVVLQHDLSSYSVEAVDKIIYWGLKNGYTFLPMTESTPMVHFKPLN